MLLANSTHPLPIVSWARRQFDPTAARAVDEIPDESTPARAESPVIFIEPPGQTSNNFEINLTVPEPRNVPWQALGWAPPISYLRYTISPDLTPPMTPAPPLLPAPTIGLNSNAGRPPARSTAPSPPVDLLDSNQPDHVIVRSTGLPSFLPSMLGVPVIMADAIVGAVDHIPRFAILAPNEAGFVQRERLIRLTNADGNIVILRQNHGPSREKPWCT
ncbi:hypothetical protein B0H14DRAFT_2623624 [Mycena olivaceomarginata]|nr:hypothetical protein B0H14DRAFT_2623624 [Mycena olivaceomarginata]